MLDEQETLEMPTAVVAPGHVIELGKLWAPWDGQWVRIKPHISYAEKLFIDSAAAQVSMNTGDKTTMNVTLRGVETAVATVQRCVLEWHLLDITGELIPANRKGITGENVPHDLMDQVIGEITDFYEAQRPKPFRESASSG